MGGGSGVEAVEIARRRLVSETGTVTACIVQSGSKSKIDASHFYRSPITGCHSHSF
jgi:hypothetical protein